jgi:negative regulator of sigma E activity
MSRWNAIMGVAAAAVLVVMVVVKEYDTHLSLNVRK